MQVEVVAPEVDQFRQAKARAIKKLEPRDVAQHLPILRAAATLFSTARRPLFFLGGPKLARRIEQRRHLFLAEKDRQPAWQLRQ